MSEEAKHRYGLGAVVEVDVSIAMPGASVEVDLQGKCRLLVVGHLRTSSLEPLYILSDLAVKYPVGSDDLSREMLEYEHFATLVQFGYEEADLRATGEVLPLNDTLEQWLDGQQRLSASS
jgi:hypothetical protein